MGKSDLFDMAAEIKAETPKAWLLFDGTKEAWVPKSQIESDSEITEDSEEGDEGELVVSDWIASEKGWE